MRLPSVPKRDDACHIMATIDPDVGVATHQHANCATNQFRFISDSPRQISQCAAELYFGARNIQFGNTVHIRFTETKQFCLYAPQYSRVLQQGDKRVMKKLIYLAAVAGSFVALAAVGSAQALPASGNLAGLSTHQQSSVEKTGWRRNHHNSYRRHQGYRKLWWSPRRMKHRHRSGH
jgi:hypothetical protein